MPLCVQSCGKIVPSEFKMHRKDGIYMKKRMRSLALVLLLVLSCTVTPALAASEDELTQVTVAVKEQLQIGDQYTGFQSSCEDLGLMRYWSLYWSDDAGGSVSVTADQTGKILYYTAYTGGSTASASGFYSPAFPKVSQEQVAQAAGAFLERVLAAPESYALEPVTLETNGFQQSVYVRGTLLLNGVETDLGFRVRVDLETLEVTYYSRDDSWSGYYDPDIPAAQPAVAAQDAEAQLHSVLALELRYVDDDDGAIALRYVPVTEGNWYVDAQTGQLTNLAQVYEGLSVSYYGSAAETAADSSADNGLTEVEQAAIEQMADALSAQELDAVVRQWEALGLADMTQAGASYTMDQDGQITCRLTYSRPLAEDELAEEYAGDPEYAAYLLSSGEAALRKYITVDAKTGAVLQVSTTDYLAKDSFSGDEAAVVQDFLAAMYPEEYAATVPTGEDGLTFTRQVNGIPYYTNYLSASVCGLDGSIRTFRMEWEEAAQFPAPEEILTLEEALELYAGCYEAALRYVAYPVQESSSDAQWLTYSRMFGGVSYRWVLTYVLDSSETVVGIDAFTGQPVGADSQNGSSTALAYTDSVNSYARTEIETLAAYGIGFGQAETFRPTAQLTQREMLVLLLNAVGYDYDVDAMDEETEAGLYEEARYQGLITQEQQDPDAPVTRMDFVRTLVGASVYGAAAQVQGIYATTFADAAAIAGEDLGYVALAEGLGIVGGDENHNFNPDRVMTRQDAAIMLFNFMSI